MNNDLISRNDLKEDFKTRLENAKRWEENAINRKDYEIAIRAKATSDFICEVIMTIDNAPTVEYPFYQEAYQTGYEEGLEDGKKITRPHGEWIIVKDERYGDNVKCPFCGKELAGTDLNFCCKCGAKLIGSEKMNGGAENDK